MTKIGLWQVKDGRPVKLKTSSFGLEKHLEDWIENDPGLLQSGLTIVARQLHTDSGPLDLLALDLQGQWVVIELKTDTLRRSTVAQVLDYAACIAGMPFDDLSDKVNKYLSQRNNTLESLLEERGLDALDQQESRDMVMYIVGTGREPGLERMVSFLAEEYNMPISLVLFSVYETEDGNKVLSRELTEADLIPEDEKERRKTTIDHVLVLADQYGLKDDFETLLSVAQTYDMYPRPYKASIMFTPPTNRTRMLFTAWAKPKADGLMRLYVGPEAFAEFYPITEEKATLLLGESGWRAMNSGEVKEFSIALERLFDQMNAQEES